MSTKLHVPGDVVLDDALDVSGELIARSGVRLTAASGPLVTSDAGSPTLAASIGSVYVRDDVAELWQNTDGSTAWSKVGGGGGGAFSGAAYYSTEPLGLPSATWVPLSYTTVDFEVGDYRVVGSQSKFKVPTDGYYRITAGARGSMEDWRDPFFWIAIAKNATAPYPSGGSFFALCERVRSQKKSITTELYLSTGVTSKLLTTDYVEVFVYQDDSRAHAVIADAATRFTIFRVG